VLAACKPSSAPPEAAAAGAGGSDSGEPELVVRPLMYTPIESPSKLLEDGDTMELWAAPQGGHVLLAGAQIQGLNSEFIEIRAALRDPDTGFMVTEAVRTVVVAPLEDQPGWVETDRSSRSQVAHLAVCPDYEPQPIEGRAYQLELTITELYDDYSTGFAAVTVVPSCQQSEDSALAHCQCECQPDYVLGKCSG
jgi:hypothetical protein